MAGRVRRAWREPTLKFGLCCGRPRPRHCLRICLGKARKDKLSFNLSGLTDPQVLVISAAMVDPVAKAELSQTPVLDMEAPLPSPVRSPLRTVLLVVEVAFLPLVIAGSQAASKPYSLFTVPLFLIVAAVAAVGVHELGHVLAGWLVGFRCMVIAIGPLSFDVTDHKMQFGSIQGMPVSGFAVMKIDRISRLRRRFLFVSAGGPAVNLISVAAVPLLIKFVFPGVENSWAGQLAVFFVVISLILALANCFPLRRRGFYTDGARIEMLMGASRETRRWLAIHGLLHQFREGINAKNWNSHWAKTAASLSDSSADELTGNWLAYVRASSCNDSAQASLLLERCLELAAVSGLAGRDFLVQEAAIFSAWFRNDVEKAKTWNTRLLRPMRVTPLHRIRWDVAFSCAGAQFDSALQSWQHGLDLIRRFPPGARSISEPSWLEWREEIEERRAKFAH